MSFGGKRECARLKEKLAVKNWELEKAVSRYNSLFKRLDVLSKDILHCNDHWRNDENLNKEYPLAAAFARGVNHGVALAYSHFAQFVGDLRRAVNDG